MVQSIDDKKYANDTRLFSDAVLQDGIFKNFTDSPVTKDLLVKDVCIYAPRSQIRFAKKVKLVGIVFMLFQMAHNVWSP